MTSEGHSRLSLSSIFTTCMPLLLLLVLSDPTEQPPTGHEGGPRADYCLEDYPLGDAGRKGVRLPSKGSARLALREVGVEMGEAGSIWEAAQYVGYKLLLPTLVAAVLHWVELGWA